jgi:hypothetical protein
LRVIGIDVIVFEAPHPVHCHHATQASSHHQRITDHQYPPLIDDLALCHPSISRLFHPRPSRSISMASHCLRWLAIRHPRRTSFPNLHSRTCQPAPSPVDASLSVHATATRPGRLLKLPPTLGIAPVTLIAHVLFRCHLVLCTQWLRFHAGVTPCPQSELTTRWTQSGYLQGFPTITVFNRWVALGYEGFIRIENKFRGTAD